ncbi:glycoside hydrolase family 16 protein [Schizophyllum amplum]|uniref:Glycoside hydrolase family 16 protein n=1 Tax=Schizophyllum amplum TaxID=97359 RepID=A0A550CYQ3_9AGAR|nr:glycoside hydrolase family 16 protein [Auriculariopsis ampla]
MESSVSGKFAFAYDPEDWGSELSPTNREPDDWLHEPDPRRDRMTDNDTNVLTGRGIANLGCLAFLAIIILGVFAGYPIASELSKSRQSFAGGFNLGGINGTGQVPDLPGNYGLIDKDTPTDALTYTPYTGQEQWELVFSDEFETDERTFYPGDDPYWEAVDLHYWGTNNMEWYDPSAITTKDGALEITLTDVPTKGKIYTGGMMSTWNKFCFTGGLFLASVTLPGSPNVAGLWPAVWAMGNLGRAGFGATLDGMWPYTYDSCDVGTLPNQTTPDGLPIAATVNGDEAADGALSYLPGQKLSRCTCLGEEHPGPVHADGTYVGRAAPEIDMFEAQVLQAATGVTQHEVSQSLQLAPFNEEYTWFNTSETLSIPNATMSALNGYKGGRYQQAASVVSHTNADCYEFDGSACFSLYGFEYKPGFDDAYVTWINDGQLAWTITAGGLARDPGVEIGPRPIPVEPMYMILNLENFGFVDVENLIFPTKMRIDWIRVYQPPDSIRIGCDPDDFPTAAYIERFSEAYTNPNLTTWVDDYKQVFPKNKLVDQC